MKEFELIQALLPRLPTQPWVVRGAGDDCAVLDAGIPGQRLLFKTDAVVEGIHFTRKDDPERVGRKALARCLSDIAAMGGTPLAALVTLGLPTQFEPEIIFRMYDGLCALASEHQVAVVGGETTSNPERTLVSIALLGLVPSGKEILRSGAKVGDAVFVSGELGGSIHGKHLDFEPRLAEARWLRDQFTVHAMIDVSDGIAGDIRHLMRESGVGVELHAESIPVSRAARQAAQVPGGKPPLLAALTDGEDFELLFVVPAREAVRLKDAWKETFPKTRISCIGKVMETQVLRLRDKGYVRDLHDHGYTHFSIS